MNRNIVWLLVLLAGFALAARFRHLAKAGEPRFEGIELGMTAGESRSLCAGRDKGPSAANFDVYKDAAENELWVTLDNGHVTQLNALYTGESAWPSVRIGDLQVRAGMSKDELVALLGPPHRQDNSLLTYPNLGCQFTFAGSGLESVHYARP